MNRAAVERWISEFVAGYAARTGVTTAWRTPLVGVADAHDPLFVGFKQVVQSTHALPEDLLPGARSVIAWFVPFDARVPQENSTPGLASRAWAVAYVETNRLVDQIARGLRGALEGEGFRAATVAPTHNWDPRTLKSDWSHRHVAFAAGLGRFGRHNLLITEAGCCGRVGSLVTDLVLGADPAPAPEGCFHHAGIACRACVDQCTFGALTDGGFDRIACYRQCLVNADVYADLGEVVDVCGKCSVAVPCSTRNRVPAGLR